MLRKALSQRLASAFLLAASHAIALPQEPPRPALPPLWPTANWAVRSPEDVGVDPGRLADFLSEVRQRQVPFHSLVVVRRGAVCLEAVWHPYSAVIRHSVESNTKAVIGALTGIAIAQKKIGSLEVALPDLFPGRLIRDEEAKRGITVRSLLTMTSGLDDADFTPGGDGLWTAPGWTQYLLDRTVVPGSGWAYRSGDAHLLAAALREATGVDARVWANQVLFTPLGIPQVGPEDWTSDPEGVASGIAGLKLSPRELAKIGFLYLHHGRWEDRQIVPEEWVRESTKVHVDLGSDPFVEGTHRGWGYLWSVFPEEGAYGYLGRGGQNLIVSEPRDLVIVMTAGLAPGQEGSLLALVSRHLFPACFPEPRVENSEGAARLTAELKALDPPAIREPVPQCWEEVSGTPWALDTNPLGWKTLTLTFYPDRGEAEATVLPTGTWRIGIDGRFRKNVVAKGQTLALRGQFRANGEWFVDQVQLESYPRLHFQLSREAGSLRIKVSDPSTGALVALLQGSPMR